MIDNCPNPCIACPPTIPGSAGLGISPLDPNYPFVNLSAEAPDLDLFVGRRGSNLGLPPLGSTWYAVGCLGFCFSDASQTDADLCAAQQAAACVSGNWPLMVPNPNPGPGEPEFIPQNRPLFFNSAQSCPFTCPDGTLFNYTVRAGIFSAFNQQTANDWASSYACIQAASNYICVSSLTATRGCVDSLFSATFFVLTPNKPVNMEIISGAIPPGMVIQQGVNPNQPTFFISGVSSSTGNYSFVVKLTDSHGNTAQKSYSIDIFGIADASQLPDPTNGQPYSFIFTIGGTPSGTVSFAIVSGSLPDGLTLNSSTGEISGTPTVEGAFQAAISVTDGTITCQKTFDLFVQTGVSACAQLFSGIVWNYISPFGTANGVSADNTLSLDATGPGVGMGTSGVQAQGQVFFQGAQMDCVLKIEISGNGGAFISINQGGAILSWDYGTVGEVPGTYLVPFTIAEDLVGNPLIITGTAGSGDVMANAEDDKTISVVYTIGT